MNFDEWKYLVDDVQVSAKTSIKKFKKIDLLIRFDRDWGQ